MVGLVPTGIIVARNFTHRVWPRPPLRSGVNVGVPTGIGRVGIRMTQVPTLRAVHTLAERCASCHWRVMSSAQPISDGDRRRATMLLFALAVSSPASAASSIHI
jgi:hypothetical protein